MRLRTVQNFKKTGQPVRERRGTHTNRPHKISADIWEMVKTHWGLYPHKETHYGRKSSRKYFENPCLNVKILYEGFKEYYFDEIGFHLKMKYCTYHRYFRENSVYSFRQPRTDVCDFCAESKVLLEANPEDPCKLKYELHKKKVETYNLLKHDLISDLQNNSKKDTIIIEFDYAQNLPIPKLNVTSQFYKRLLWLYNFNVHCHNDQASSFYCFLETDAKKGPNTVCSFVYDFLVKKLKEFPNLKKVVFLSDSCGGQNQNITVVMFTTWLSKNLNVTIEHIFPVRGHSYNQCDRNFGRYSIVLKKIEKVETAKQYLQVMSTCRKKPSPFEVSMASYLIEGWNEALSKCFSKTPTAKNRRFAIQQYVKIQYEPNGNILPFTRYNWSDDVFVFKKNLSLPKNSLGLEKVSYVGVKEEKKKDVLALTSYLKPENAEWMKNVISHTELSGNGNNADFSRSDADFTSK
jgi:hypothetical protein